jgi:hypothetical protein
MHGTWRIWHEPARQPLGHGLCCLATSEWRSHQAGTGSGLARQLAIGD